METQRPSLEELEDLAKDPRNAELKRFLEGIGGTPALKKVIKPHKYQRVNERQQRAVRRCK